MSTVDLVLLGLVYEQPMSAYDMQKQVTYRHIGKWVRISSPSIYKKTLQLEAKGYLTSEPMREGKMPEKTVYAITPSGRTYFETLMVKNAQAAVNVFFEFNAVIGNLNKLPKDQALSLIGDIGKGIAASKAYMAHMVPQRAHVPLIGRTILQQQIGVLSALLSWIAAFQADFELEGGGEQGGPERTP